MESPFGLIWKKMENPDKEYLLKSIIVNSPTFVGFFVYRIGGIVLIIAIKLSLTSIHPENFIYHTSTADSIKQ